MAGRGSGDEGNLSVYLPAQKEGRRRGRARQDEDGGGREPFLPNRPEAPAPPDPSKAGCARGRARCGPRRGPVTKHYGTRGGGARRRARLVRPRPVGLVGPAGRDPERRPTRAPAPRAHPSLGSSSRGESEDEDGDRRGPELVARRSGRAPDELKGRARARARKDARAERGSPLQRKPSSPDRGQPEAGEESGGAREEVQRRPRSAGAPRRTGPTSPGPARETKAKTGAAQSAAPSATGRVTSPGLPRGPAREEVAQRGEAARETIPSRPGVCSPVCPRSQRSQ